MTRHAADTARRRATGGSPAADALPPLVAVVGPTASGKSGLALALAERFGGEIVSTDSLQVYRGLDIGTAKPTAAERTRVPHHLIDVAAPDEPYSAGRYVADARAALADIVARGRVPILCGGTGLYYRALLYGLVEVPPVPDAVQAAVEARLAAEGAPAVHAALARVDPEAAAGIHPHDPVRIARALGVYQATGRPLSAWQRTQPPRPAAPEVLSVGLRWERRVLYARIDRRVEAMLEAGWLDEVRDLLAQGVDPALKPLRAIGYREIVAHLRAGGAEHGPEREALAARIAQRTRRYAKRQLTWFRQHPEILWAPADDAGRLEAAVRKFLPEARARG